MTDLSITAQWLDADLDYPEETATFAEIVLALGDTTISQVFDHETGLLADGPRLPAVVLADGLIRSWWVLLYESQKLEDDPKFQARHRLDSLVPGYVFPPLAVWSSGEAVTAEMFDPDTRFQRQMFLLPERRGPWTMSRGAVEGALSSFIGRVLDRLATRGVDRSSLAQAWERIGESVHDPDERIWCINAGRLGLDPYDSDTPDLARISAGLSDSLFGDVCEATEPSELSRTCNWVRGAAARLPNAPALPIRHFGAPHRRDLTQPGWRDGYDSARLLRSRIALTQDPRRASETLLGDALQSAQARLDDNTPASMEGLTRRNGPEMRTIVSARSARQRRFRMYRAAYLAWRAGQDGEAAITTASTWRQQASRAFAAELLAPAELLRERAGKGGLTQDVVERLATEWVCPPLAIIHQAQNHGVPLRGVQMAVHY